MAGPVNAPSISRKKAMGFANQSTPGTPVTITSADCIDVSSVSYSPNAITSTDPRYTGSIHRPGEILIGATWSVDFEWLIHGIGNNAVPAANAFLPGRILQQWGFTENRFTTGIASEAYSAGTTTAATLGATAAGTLQLYKGLVVNFASVAAAPGGFAMIRDYQASKVATLARLHTGFSATGNYTIPQQLAYTSSIVDPVAGASITVWEDGHRLNFADMRPTAATIQLVTAGRDGSDSYCKLTGSFSGTLVSEANEAAPAVTISTAIPPMRNGRQDIAHVQIGGSSVTIDLGLRSGYPSNPNQTEGYDAGVVVESKRAASYELYKVARTVVDFNALALAQSQWASQFFWGLAAGNYMGVMIDQQRFNYRSTQEGQDFITTQGDSWIDGMDKALSITFPVLY